MIDLDITNIPSFILVHKDSINALINKAAALCKV